MRRNIKKKRTETSPESWNYINITIELYYFLRTYVTKEKEKCS